MLDEWRAAGVVDLRAHLRARRGRIEACIERIRIVRVNRWTLSLFEVADLDQLVANLGRIFRDDMLVISSTSSSSSGTAKAASSVVA